MLFEEHDEVKVQVAVVSDPYHSDHTCTNPL
jgi:hypothetical protein